MLAHLHVKNLALIEEIEVEFGPGLNILTGETGAGKSILLGSMQLILGAKTSKNMIRENAPYALVELLFQIENEKAKEALKELDIYPEDGQVLLSRKIMDGRSINKINGETSTVGQMKAAAACLLDIHGQHEHQSLLYQDKQLAILDAYGKNRVLPVKDKVRAKEKKLIFFTGEKARAQKLLEELEGSRFKARERFLRAILEAGSLDYTYASKELGASISVLDFFEKKGLIKIESQEMYRIPKNSGLVKEDGELSLNQEQQEAVAEIFQEWQKQIGRAHV